MNKKVIAYERGLDTGRYGYGQVTLKSARSWLLIVGGFSGWVMRRKQIKNSVLLLLFILCSFVYGQARYTVEWSTSLLWLADTSIERYQNLMHTILWDDSGSAQNILVCGIGRQIKPIAILLDTDGTYLFHSYFNIALGSWDNGNLDNFTFRTQLSNGSFICEHLQYNRTGSGNITQKWNYYLIEIKENSFRHYFLYSQDYWLHDLYRFDQCHGYKSFPESRASRIVMMRPSYSLQKHTYNVSDPSPPPSPSTVNLSIYKTDNLYTGVWDLMQTVQDDAPSPTQQFYKLQIDR